MAARLWRWTLAGTRPSVSRVSSRVLARRLASTGGECGEVPWAVNSEAYPLHYPKHCNELVERCRGEIRVGGYCHLPGFVRAEAAEELCREFTSLEERGHGFRSFESHNVYLEDNEASGGRDADAATVSVRDKEWASSKVLVAQDSLPQDSGLLAIYRWRALQDFLQQVFDLPALHPSADPFGGVYYNLFDGAHKDTLGWHFDRSKFSMNLILQTATGGNFQYVQDSRPAIDGMTHWGEVEDFIADKTTTPELAPGSLYLFAGNRSLHQVTPVIEGKRVNAILTYFEAPGQTLNEYTLQKFFGRSHAAGS